MLLAVAACGEQHDTGGAERRAVSASPPASPCALDAPAGEQCGLSESELRNLNLRYADRLPFEGDARELARAVARVQRALAPVREQSVPGVISALTAAGFDERQIVTSANAVRTAGLAYAVQLLDGCVFGSFQSGRFSVESGGWVRDGGCLASYGH